MPSCRQTRRRRRTARASTGYLPSSRAAGRQRRKPDSRRRLWSCSSSQGVFAKPTSPRNRIDRQPHSCQGGLPPPSVAFAASRAANGGTRCGRGCSAGRFVRPAAGRGPAAGRVEGVYWRHFDNSAVSVWSGSKGVGNAIRTGLCREAMGGTIHLAEAEERTVSWDRRGIGSQSCQVRWSNDSALGANREHTQGTLGYESAFRLFTHVGHGLHVDRSPRGGCYHCLACRNPVAFIVPGAGTGPSRRMSGEYVELAQGRPLLLDGT